jgi:DNA polymerase III alpha subunit
MRTDKYGQRIYTENELCNILLCDPTKNITSALVEDSIPFIDDIVENPPDLVKYIDPKLSINEFDKLNQNNWYFPKEYQEFDIASWVLDQCTTQEELQRAGAELILFQEKDMFILLKYLKFLVDTMRKHNIVWGVGRGSSVASFVLFLIGVHKINSLHYDLPIEEFLK